MGDSALWSALTRGALADTTSESRQAKVRLLRQTVTTCQDLRNKVEHRGVDGRESGVYEEVLRDVYPAFYDLASSLNMSDAAKDILGMSCAQSSFMALKGVDFKQQPPVSCP
jgi:hypothetical protein